jgi:hypothetical protein
VSRNLYVHLHPVNPFHVLKKTWPSLYSNIQAMAGRKICKIGYSKYIRNNGLFNGSLTQLLPWTSELKREYNMRLYTVTLVENTRNFQLQNNWINALTVLKKLILMQFSLNASVSLPCFLIVPESVGRHSALSISFIY